jgi:hypothetical protein
MSTVEEIESAIRCLSRHELAILRNHFAQFDVSAWDQQFEQNVIEGRLDSPDVEALKELTIICKGQYRMGIQTKLMNTIHIILTHNIDYFPAE